MSEESKKKMSLSRKGKKFTDEHKAALSASLRKVERLPEQYEKMVKTKATRTYVYDEEFRGKISKASKERWQDPEYRERVLSKRRGQKRSEEFRKHQSEMQRGEKGPMYGKHHTDEAKRKISEANTGDKNAAKRPEVRAKLAGKNNPRWRGGVSFGKYCYKFNQPFKEFIREKFSRTCIMCGKHESNCNRKLAIHHTDYNKNSICNGKSWAFVPLCDKCHGKTNHNCWIWFNLLINYWVYFNDIQIVNITDNFMFVLPKYESYIIQSNC